MRRVLRFAKRGMCAGDISLEKQSNVSHQHGRWEDKVRDTFSGLWNCFDMCHLEQYWMQM